jgi:hypothetical protein
VRNPAYTIGILRVPLLRSALLSGLRWLSNARLTVASTPSGVTAVNRKAEKAPSCLAGRLRKRLNPEWPPSKTHGWSG